MRIDYTLSDKHIIISGGRSLWISARNPGRAAQPVGCTLDKNECEESTVDYGQMAKLDCYGKINWLFISQTVTFK